MLYDVTVIGGGAAGIAAAISASEQQANVLLIERGNRLGRKILASGNGRCNILNKGQFKYYGDSKFAESVLSECSFSELVSFFRQYGLFLTDERDGRVYPSAFQSASVLDVLKTALSLRNVEVKLQSSVQSLRKDSERFAVFLDDGQSIYSRRIVIACGGLSQPKLGGTDSGYKLLSSFGHPCTPLFPALVPLITDSLSISGLSGSRVQCTVSVKYGSEVLHSETGEVLFTDYGISGICIMQCARFLQNPGMIIELDFVRSIIPDSEELYAELLRRQRIFSIHSPLTLLEGILSSRIAFAVLKQAGIPLRGEICADLTKEDLKKIAITVSHYRIQVTGTKGFEFAQVTSGGIDCSKFDSHTMESGIISGLYAAGEVLNVDGDCGGFNLMFAFASGRLAGKSAGHFDRSVRG